MKREELALHFEGMPAQSGAGNGQKKSPAPLSSPPRSVSLPIRVRPRHVPWFEEAMTLEVSGDKLRFVSNREYALGDALLVTYPSGDAKPWQGTGEFLARIVSVDKLPQSSSLVITVMRLTD
jgi:hypothetical protein